MRRIILASASPRRKELLMQIGLEFDIIPSHIEEVLKGNSPEENVMGLAQDKARDVFEQLRKNGEMDALVIGADTIVVLDEMILGKPKDEADAFRMLKALQGRTHQVYTGVCLMNEGETQTFYEKTDVIMYPASDEQLWTYIAGKEPMDKAGSYAIQGKGTVFIREIRGDYNNVVGLPVAQIWQRLQDEQRILHECHCRAKI